MTFFNILNILLISHIRLSLTSSLTATLSLSSRWNTDTSFNFEFFVPLYNAIWKSCAFFLTYASRNPWDAYILEGSKRLNTALSLIRFRLSSSSSLFFHSLCHPFHSNITLFTHSHNTYMFHYLHFQLSLPLPSQPPPTHPHAFVRKCESPHCFMRYLRSWGSGLPPPIRIWFLSPPLLRLPLSGTNTGGLCLYNEQNLPSASTAHTSQTFPGPPVRPRNN